MSVKYLCVINLACIHKPMPVRQREGMGDGLWDRSGNWNVTGKSARGYREWVFDTKREADCWYAGARGVAAALQEFCK